jgi:predicted glycoside hydrolase/deacetylase ChbG (UPF0249 family)
MSRLLIVNADDFGFTRDVNRGIVHAHRHGIVTATTLMANGDAFDDAVRLARETPALDVGCHLVLVQGRSVLDPSRCFPTTVARLVAAVLARRLKIYEELAAQLRRIVDAGIQPTHLDSHKHTHVLGPVLDAVVRLSEDFRIPWVRRVRRLARSGCRTTDHFTGFRMTGKLDTPRLVRAIAELGEGTTEFMCHPGYCAEELKAAPTRLKESRQIELEALTAGETRAALQASGVELTNYRELNAGRG